VDSAAAQAVRGRGGAPWDQERGAEDDYAVDERGRVDPGECGEPSSEVSALPEADAGSLQRRSFFIGSVICFHTCASEFARLSSSQCPFPWSLPWPCQCSSPCSHDVHALSPSHDVHACPRHAPCPWSHGHHYAYFFRHLSLPSLQHAAPKGLDSPCSQ